MGILAVFFIVMVWIFTLLNKNVQKKSINSNSKEKIVYIVSM